MLRGNAIRSFPFLFDSGASSAWPKCPPNPIGDQIMSRRDASGRTPVGGHFSGALAVTCYDIVDSVDLTTVDLDRYSRLQWITVAAQVPKKHVSPIRYL